MNIPNYKDIPEEFKGQGLHTKNKWVKFQMDWFFCGVEEMHFFKDGKEIHKEIWKPILREIAPIQQSFDIKHEHKEAVVAYLLSQHFDDVQYRKCQ
jgi:hypothetical protein